MIENIVNGGYTMIALAACSLLSVAVIIERGIRLRRRRILPIPMLAAVRSFRPGDPDPGEAGEAPLGKVLSAIYRNRNLSWELDNEAAQVGLKQAEATMEQGLVILEIVAVISPLLGLLGTVLGMVKVFGVISQVGIGQAQAMAGGIYEALVTTIAGLIVAIPALVAHGIYVSKVDRLLVEIEEVSGALQRKLYGSGSGE